MSDRVLIAGVSTRAAAESAARAGFQVTAIDAFADLDQHPSVRALSLPRDFGREFSPAAVAAAVRGMAFDAVTYLSSFENHQRAVASLATSRALWGNPVGVLRRARDPLTVSESLRRRRFTTPKVHVPARRRAGVPDPGNDTDERAVRESSLQHLVPDIGERWLVKPVASGGGQRVRPWRGRVPRGHYVQECVPGIPYSVVFVANGRDAVVLGVSRQLAGDGVFGAHDYRYCGSILTAAADLVDPAHARLVSRATALASAAAAEFGLVGVNGVDFIDAGAEPVPIEINPRWCASMELVEKVHALSVFGAHAEACRSGELPAFDFIHTAADAPAVGKAIVFARDAGIMGDTRSWLDDRTIRDIPHPGERIAAGQPVCTVFASGRATADCYHALAERAVRVYADLAAWAQAVA